MVEKLPIFTVDLEDWYHAVMPRKDWPAARGKIYQNCFFITDLLKKYHVKAVIYCLGHLIDKEPELLTHFEWEGHRIKSHGYWHRRGEIADRPPFAWLGFTGGFYFRAFPYYFIKSQVIKNKLFYCHPHDFYENHPQLKNPFLNWKRHVGLKTSRPKLERLLSEVEFGEPSQN